MMKRTAFSLVLVFLLTMPVMFFQSCPTFSKNVEQTNLQRPSWATNKAGSLSVDIINLDPKIEYNPTEAFSNSYTVVCRSYIYSGEKRTYNINYRILSSVIAKEVRGSCTVDEAEYDPIKGVVYPFEIETKEYNLEIPKGLEAIQAVNINIEYNISNLLTKINIPMNIKKPASGSVLTIDTPIYYTASPIIPKSDKIKIDVTSRSVIFYIELIDAVECFKGYKKPPQFKFGENIKVTATAAGVNLDGISCTPTTITSLPALIRCSIDLTKNKDIYNLFSSEAGTYLEVSINLDYSCSMIKSYNIQIIRQI